MTADDRRRDVPGLAALLREHFGAGIEPLQPLTGGVFSRAYGFAVEGCEYVVRINSAPHAAGSFAKDEYAGRAFASADLPIPRIVARGATGDWHYAISERVAGRPLSICSESERQRALSSALDTLEAAGKADTSTSQGYGDWGVDGNGKFGSWQAYLADVIENHAEGYYQDWHRLFETSCLERDVYETVYERMLELSGRCPNERALIHNDFHFDNVLANGERITGVVDWANALYGDPLYDVAWLDRPSLVPGWWYDDSDILWERFGGAPDYKTRITCYQLHVGLDHLRYFAKNERPEDYQLCREWLLARIEGDAPRS